MMTPGQNRHWTLQNICTLTLTYLSFHSLEYFIYLNSLKRETEHRNISPKHLYLMNILNILFTSVSQVFQWKASCFLTPAGLLLPPVGHHDFFLWTHMLSVRGWVCSSSGVYWYIGVKLVVQFSWLDFTTLWLSRSVFFRAGRHQS